MGAEVEILEFQSEHLGLVDVLDGLSKQSESLELEILRSGQAKIPLPRGIEEYNRDHGIDMPPRIKRQAL